ncbi:kinase/pyrophosphorylase [Neoehrlichia mikurensis]|uniref:Putative pyruvate, phosphate dikinase regulatory protein n=1 Tax=Neoehrlichia mikurensis TaxID=89586 RepID=A0A9Q9BR16_9RICK|nr:pyruvate, water dikinase regulatory protein [Neoehrlichia mikurensis]QXK92131.1 kinase/pyrophosphorylase [Neoehrlichia mikurensis]QXK92588.1 kinase/pyrophosphorylase [Neoehrlichia mikurensis]QXK93825.1 kinase/pyrophosphorylase [Neoehrlichia mikurensis]UTO55180.1 kinase/pyrophosphorylase [Neoehrlichia mikurensis]UTO56100.1 kinase/pyrophosphorylase [Neoehrlichia mikurensis]
MTDKLTLNLHLVSDSTCETVISVARSALEHFTSVKVNEFVWSLVSSYKQIDKIILVINPEKYNLIMYTMVDDKLREYLKEKANAQNVRCIPILSHIIREISCYLHIAKDINVSASRLNDEYFNRIDAINYTIAHDDGQSLWDIDKADIIIVGVSRTSKSPTSIYLAYRGYKVVNIPLVHSIDIPVDLSMFKDKLIVGLTINIDRLIQIRKNRLISMKNYDNHEYVNYRQVFEEINLVKKICTQNGWPIIDVTQKSVEEIAATIIQFFNKN